MEFKKENFIEIAKLCSISYFNQDFMNKTFQEIDSGVKNQNLSGSCSEKSREYLEKFTYELENQFQEWSQLE